MTPAGLDFGRTDGQLSLIDPFLNNADKNLGPRRPWEINDGALIMMETKDNNKRAASRPPNNDGGSPDAKRQRSLTEAEIDELFVGPSGGVPIDGHSESASMVESTQEVLNALIHERKAKGLTLQELYEQASKLIEEDDALKAQQAEVHVKEWLVGQPPPNQQVPGPSVTSVPAADSISMMDAIEIMNQDLVDLQDRHANVVRINQGMTATIDHLQSVNQKLTLQGGFAQVLSDKNQQISNQQCQIHELQQYYGFMLNQAQDNVRAILAKDRVLRQQNTDIGALHRRVEELERFTQHYPALVKSNDIHIEQQKQTIDLLQRQVRENSDAAINNMMLKSDLFNLGSRYRTLMAENVRLTDENAKLGGHSRWA